MKIVLDMNIPEVWDSYLEAFMRFGRPEKSSDCATGDSGKLPRGMCATSGVLGMLNIQATGLEKRTKGSRVKINSG
jgi:hypothetical protein